MNDTPLTPHRRILIVDDSRAIQEDFRKILAGKSRPQTNSTDEAVLFGKTRSPIPAESFDLDAAYQGAEAVEKVRGALSDGRPFAMAFVDVRMPPGQDGVETAVQLWALDADLQIVLCTAYADYSWGEIVRRLGRSDRLVILKKPFDNIETLQLACALTEKWRLGRAARLQQANLEKLVQERTRDLQAESERRGRIAEELGRSEAFLNSLLENLPACVYRNDEEGRFTFANQRYCALLNRSLDNIIGKTEEEIWPPAIARKHRQEDLLVMETGQPQQRVEPLPLASGEDCWMEIIKTPLVGADGRITGTQGMGWDITERKRLEAELLQAQKMEVIGLLASGVAHDFNNHLTVIFGRASLLLDNQRLDPAVAEGLKHIYAAGDRAAGLVRQLLIFSRKRVPLREVIDLHGAIRDTAKMLRHLIGEPIELVVNLAPTDVFVNADSGMLDQLLMNLAVNARDAMPKGGHLFLGTEVSRFTEAPPAPGARAGDFVCLSMRDTGTGIPPEVLSRIFEAFFTTKEVGRGTGLGLATVRDIVRHHEGWIEVDSRVGAGTAFRVFLPLVPAGVLAASRQQIEAPPLGGHETVLLVEDEIHVREFACAVLRSHGYSVLQAQAGEDALEVWSRHGRKIKVLVTDIVLPGDLSGPDLAAKMQAAQPELKSVFMSGYSNEAMQELFALRQDVQFLHKPYRPRDLLKVVRDALDGRTSTAQPWNSQS